MKWNLTITLLMSILAGCSGLDAKSEFSCKAPNGVSCRSVSGIYANSVAGVLPAQKAHKRESEEESSAELAMGEDIAGMEKRHATSMESMSIKAVETPSSGTPLRSNEIVLRAWIAPWVDADQRLHDQHFVYLTVKTAGWRIEANRQRIKDQFTAIRPLSAPAADGADTPNSRTETEQEALDLVNGSIDKGQAK